MHQLVETVLTIGAWLTHDDWSSFDALGKANTRERHSLAIAFHIQLLDVRGESEERLAVWEDSP